MTSQMIVDLSELDAWADQVDRASNDLEAVSRNASTHLAQADFGPILEALMGSYNVLTSQVNDTLAQDALRMRNHGEALRATSRDFMFTEASVSRQYRSDFVDGRDGSTRFFDLLDTTVPTAYPTESELPKVSFGFPYDTVCDLVAAFTGFDVRRELAEKIGGDIVGASSQGSSLGAVGRSVQAVATNVESGSQAISQTWQGGASQAALQQAVEWVGELNSQAGKLMQMGLNMFQVCRNAWQVAQSVVQCIKSAVQTVSSALATLSIPGVGWARVVQAIWQAFQALMKAFKVIKQFISLVKTLAQYVEAIKTYFDTGRLPESDASGPTSTGTPVAVVEAPSAVRTPIFGGQAATA